MIDISTHLQYSFCTKAPHDEVSHTFNFQLPCKHSLLRSCPFLTFRCPDNTLVRVFQNSLRQCPYHFRNSHTLVCFYLQNHQQKCMSPHPRIGISLGAKCLSFTSQTYEVHVLCSFVKNFVRGTNSLKCVFQKVKFYLHYT